MYRSDEGVKVVVGGVLCEGCVWKGRNLCDRFEE